MSLAKFWLGKGPEWIFSYPKWILSDPFRAGKCLRMRYFPYKTRAVEPKLSHLQNQRSAPVLEEPLETPKNEPKMAQNDQF